MVHTKFSNLSSSMHTPTYILTQSSKQHAENAIELLSKQELQFRHIYDINYCQVPVIFLPEPSCFAGNIHSVAFVQHIFWLFKKQLDKSLNIYGIKCYV